MERVPNSMIFHFSQNLAIFLRGRAILLLFSTVLPHGLDAIRADAVHLIMSSILSRSIQYNPQKNSNQA